jgi:hypothetical protein
VMFEDLGAGLSERERAALKTLRGMIVWAKLDGGDDSVARFEFRTRLKGMNWVEEKKPDGKAFDNAWSRLWKEASPFLAHVEINGEQIKCSG